MVLIWYGVLKLCDNGGMRESLPILYQDPWLVVIDKPAGVHVHPPEDQSHRISAAQNGLARLRDQVGGYVYPVHRLDPPTTGVLIYALSPEICGAIQKQFQAHQVSKAYWAFCRGHFQEKTGIIDRHMKRDGSGTLAAAVTDYRVLREFEFPYSTGPHPKSRYTWLECRPRSGVWHQIRRHLAGASHPIVGDVMHGDGKHNRAFKAFSGIDGLWLRCVEMRFEHPVNQVPVVVQAPEEARWKWLSQPASQYSMDFGRGSLQRI